MTEEDREEYEKWVSIYGIPRQEALIEKIYYLTWGIFSMLFLILLILFF